MVSILLALGLTLAQPTVSVQSVTLEKVKSVTVSDITTAQAEVTWKKQSAALQYQVRVKNADGDVVYKKKTERRRLTVKELNADTTYTVQVRALRKSKSGAWSKAVAFTTLAEAEDTSLYDDYKAVAGTSTGEWQNITYGTSGDATTTVEVNADGTTAFTLDLGGLVFGLLDPDAKTYESTYDETGAVFTAEDDDLFGDVTITIVNNGNDTAQITFEGLDVPVAGISSITAEGTLYDDSVDLDYTITFADTLTATGVMNLTKTE